MPGCCRDFPQFSRSHSVTVVAIDTATGALLWKRPWRSDPPGTYNWSGIGAVLAGAGLRVTTQYGSQPYITETDPQETKEIDAGGDWTGAQPRGDTSAIDWSGIGTPGPGEFEDAVIYTAGSAYYLLRQVPQFTPALPSFAPWNSLVSTANVARYDAAANAVLWSLRLWPTHGDVIPGIIDGDYLVSSSVDTGFISAWNAGVLAWTIEPEETEFGQVFNGYMAAGGVFYTKVLRTIDGDGNRVSYLQTRSLSDGSLSSEIEDPYNYWTPFPPFTTQSYAFMRPDNGVIYGRGRKLESGLPTGPLQICTGAAEVLFEDDSGMLGYTTGPVPDGIVPAGIIDDEWGFSTSGQHLFRFSGGAMQWIRSNVLALDVLPDGDAAYVLTEDSVRKIDAADGSTIWQRPSMMRHTHTGGGIANSGRGHSLWLSGGALYLIGIAAYTSQPEAPTTPEDFTPIYP